MIAENLISSNSKKTNHKIANDIAVFNQNLNPTCNNNKVPLNSGNGIKE
jgi:hypothetical protein